MVDQINRLSDELGISAEAVVRSTTAENIAAGRTDGNFAINGVHIGEVDVQENDANGALVKSINQKSNQHGVFASIDYGGRLTMTSMDGRAIAVTHGEHTNAVLGGESNLSTLGYIMLSQHGAAEIDIYDRDLPTLDGPQVAVDGNLVLGSGAWTTHDSVLASGSVLGAGSVVNSGSTIESTLRVSGPNGFTLAQGSELVNVQVGAGEEIAGVGEVRHPVVSTTSGSTLTAGTTLINSILGANTEINGVARTSQPVSASGTIGANSVLAADSVIAAGTDFGTVFAGTTFVVGSGVSLSSGSTIGAGSQLVSGSTIGAGTDLSNFAEATVELNGAITTTSGSTLGDGTTLQNAVLGAGTTFTGPGSMTTSGPSTFASGTIGNGSELAADTVIGSGTTLSTAFTIKEIASGNGLSGSALKTGTTLEAGSVLANGTSGFSLSGAQALLLAAGMNLSGADQTVGDHFNSGANNTLHILSTAGGPFIQLQNQFVLTADGLSGANDLVLKNSGANNVIAAGSLLGAGSVMNNNVELDTTQALTADLLLSSDNADTTVATGSTLLAGTENVSGAIHVASGNITGGTMSLAAGSDIGADSVLATDGTVLSDGFTTDSTLTVATGETVTLANGSTIAADSELSIVGTVLAGDVKLGEGGITVGGSNWAHTGSNITIADGSALHTGTSLDQEIHVGSTTLSVSGTMTLSSGSTIGAGSVLNTDSVLSDDVEFSSLTTSEDIVLADGTVINTGSTIGGTVEDDSALVVASGELQLAAGSYLAANSELADNSTIGGSLLVNDEVEVSSGATMLVGAGSLLAEGSVLAAGTELTFDLYNAAGALVARHGEILDSNFTVGAGGLEVLHHLELAAGSKVAQNSVLEVVEESESAAISKTDTEVKRLSDVNVTTQADAQLAIAIADAALKDLNKVRADLGSVQNQLTSTISNISTTRVNISAAESGIRDVDFADEAANFSKFQVLNQAGSFAMAQANATAENVLSLLQG
ncbi:flagellin [Desulfurivibrio dismutans]|uniref:beta strand repeat-containing protein n=1 Tax=Desulfurivibrio dismutans TaxID=1398908 RepID=UPI003D64CE97